MTVDKLLSLLVAVPPPPLQNVGSRSIQIPPRNRHPSLGSTGSYDGISSSSGSPSQLEDLWFLPSRASSGSSSPDQCEQRGCGESSKGNVNPTRYKTELCRPFQENSYCKYGDKCQFAHGVHELRSLSRHPKYKTELCRTFHSNGVCNYGSRCHFIHNEDELRLTQITHQKRQQLFHQMAQHVAHQQILSQIKSHMVKDVFPLPQIFLPPMCATRPKPLDFAQLPHPVSLSSTGDSPPASVTDSSPSLSPVSSVLSPEELFAGIATPPPGFTVPPPPLFRRTNTPSPLTTFPTALEASLVNLTHSDELAVRCVSPPTPHKMEASSPKKWECPIPAQMSPPLLSLFNCLKNA